jgi:hypothetical protein
VERRPQAAAAQALQPFAAVLGHGARGVEGEAVVAGRDHLAEGQGHAVGVPVEGVVGIVFLPEALATAQ